MLIVFLVLAALIVFAVAAATVGGTVARLGAQRPAAVLKIEDAVEWISDRLPFEVAAQISTADVDRVLRWHLDYFDQIGLASAYGEELGGEVVPVDHEPVIAQDEDAVDYVVAKAMADGHDIEALHVVCVLDLQLQYLEQIGAIGSSIPETDS